jgi:hypothetical protein
MAMCKLDLGILFASIDHTAGKGLNQVLLNQGANAPPTKDLSMEKLV